MTDIRQAFGDAIKRWSAVHYPATMREVVANFTGRIFNRRTGKGLRSVQQSSKIIAGGMRFAADSPAIIAWMTGANRKAYTVVPVKASVLSWIDKRSGQRRFARKVRIPAWRFTPKRPAIEDAINRRRGHIEAGLGHELEKIRLDAVVRVNVPT